MDFLSLETLREVKMVVYAPPGVLDESKGTLEFVAEKKKPMGPLPITPTTMRVIYPDGDNSERIVLGNDHHICFALVETIIQFANFLLAGSKLSLFGAEHEKDGKLFFWYRPLQ